MWRKNLHCWLPAYLLSHAEPFESGQPVHLYFCFADHFEPLWGGVREAAGVERVRRWLREYPPLADAFGDDDGRPPQHSFFFPAEEYRPPFLEQLRALCQAGYGDVEVHLHHDRESSGHFVDVMEEFLARLRQHGFLEGRDRRHRFGFIHGNWALDNSRRDGRWCGLNNEIELLCQLGCYADFTFPSAPSETQPAMVNTIYYAHDDPARPKSYNHGRPAHAGFSPADDELCLITGPLGFDLRSRKFGIFPRIENGDISGGLRCDLARCRRWLRLGARVLGAPNHVFVKVHTHGTQERLYDCVLGEQARLLYRSLGELRKEGVRLHYVTAHEMWRAMHALEERDDPLRAIRSGAAARPRTRPVHADPGAP